MTYHFTLNLDDPLAIVTGVASITAMDGGHDGLTVSDWQVLGVAEIGEPVLFVDLGDEAAVAVWEARHHSVVVAALDRWVDRLDPFTVAADEAGLALDRAIDEAADGAIEDARLARVLH